MSLEQWTCWPKITPSLSYHIPFSCSTLCWSHSLSSPLPVSPLSLDHLTLSAAVTWTCTPLSHYSFLIINNCSWKWYDFCGFLPTFSPLKKIMGRKFWPSLLVSLVLERQAQPLPQSWQRLRPQDVTHLIVSFLSSLQKDRSCYEHSWCLPLAMHCLCLLGILKHLGNSNPKQVPPLQDGYQEMF